MCYGSVRTLFLSTIFASLLVLSACNSDNNKPGSSSNSSHASASITAAPIDVMQQVQRSALSVAANQDSPNFLSNGNFEDGKSNWSECSEVGSGAAVVVDAYEGSSALKLNSGNCFYQSVDATPGSDLILSCYSKLSNEFRWTGLGLGFSDVSWNTLSKSPATIITGSEYARYDVRATAPDNTRYVSMWFYTETPALIDNCVLATADNTIDPPVTAYNESNLLDNGQFQQVTNHMPSNWVKYCGGSASAGPGNGDGALMLDSGACVSQSLDSGKLAILQAKEIELTCNYEFTGNDYAALIINLNGQDYVATINANTNIATRKFKAPSEISSGFVSIYSEGEPNSLAVLECTLAVEKPVEPNLHDNLLANGSFDQVDENNKPQQWTKGCRGRWEIVDSPVSSAALELVNDGGSPCVSQVLDNNAITLLNNRAFEFSCDVLQPEGAFASMSIRYNDNKRISSSGQIPNSISYEKFTLRGSLGPVQSASVSLSGGAGTRFDNCALTTSERSGEIADLSIRLNVKGTDYYDIAESFEYDVVVVNTGTTLLTDIEYYTTGSGADAEQFLQGNANTLTCGALIDSLSPGEESTIRCVSSGAPEPGDTIRINGFASASTPDSTTINDSDATGHTSPTRVNPDFLLSIIAKDGAIAIGEDATMVVTAASLGQVLQLEMITSSVADCERTFNPVLLVGNYQIYECTVPNVQQDMLVTVQARSCDTCAIWPYFVERTDSAAIKVIN